MKKFKQKLILAFLTVFTFLSQPCHAFFFKKHKPVNTFSLSKLLENMEQYKTTNREFHEGNLKQHSIWTAQAVKMFFATEDSWCNGLDEQDEKILVTAALLHDVGKGGDLEFNYELKPFHEIWSMNCSLSKTPYYLNEKDIFDFNAMFKTLRFTKEEQKLVTLLVGAHSEFGEIVKHTKLKDLKDPKQTVLCNHLKSLLKTLILLTQIVDYDKEKIDSKLIKMLALLTAADIKGSQPVYCKLPLKIGDIEIETDEKNTPSAKKNSNYDKLGYEIKGKKIRKQLLAIFEDSQK